MRGPGPVASLLLAEARGAAPVLVAAAVLLAAYGATVRHGPALADEFIYLAGARHFALEGSLDARYYDADAIVRRGHPHQDVHTPGYVLLLGAASRLFAPGYATAIGLNVLAYVCAALLVRSLAGALGADARTATGAALLMLLLPGALPYVYWAMAETVLTVLVLAAVTLAARRGERPGGAGLAGIVLGLAFLVRESSVFALPALLTLVRGRRRLWCGASFLLVVLLVYAPLSRDRAPGGANFWAPTGGRAFGYEAVAAAREGRVSSALASVARRAAANARELVGPTTTWTERGILAFYVAVALLAAASLRLREGRVRPYTWAVLVAFGTVAVLLVGVYVVVQWSGFRYAMFLIPLMLPLAIPPTRWGAVAGGALALAALALLPATQGILDTYKTSRQRRQARLAEYVERYVRDEPGRIVLDSGWLYGLRHYPVEVVSSLPDYPDVLRSLEQRIWFDVLVIFPAAEIRQDVESRPRYSRLNADDPDPPLLIYRRVAAAERRSNAR